MEDEFGAVREEKINQTKINKLDASTAAGHVKQELLKGHSVIKVKAFNVRLFIKIIIIIL